MRRIAVFMLAAIISSGLMSVPAVAQGSSTPSFEAAGTDAQHVEAFLKSLQLAVAIDNRLKVASLVDFPMQAWVGGESVTIRSESDFQARYSRIFDQGLKKTIASAKLDTLAASQQGVVAGGRICFRPVTEHKNAIRVVAINGPASK